MPVEAAEAIGQAGGNPQRYRNEAPSLLYAVSLLDYLTPELQAQVHPKMGDFQGKRRTKPPLPGQITKGEAGAAMSNRFRVGEPFYPEDPHLALVKGNVDPGRFAISAGTSPGALAGSVGRFSPVASGTQKRRFDEVPPGMLACYPTEPPGTAAPAGRVLLQL